MKKDFDAVARLRARLAAVVRAGGPEAPSARPSGPPPAPEPLRGADPRPRTLLGRRIAEAIENKVKGKK